MVDAARQMLDELMGRNRNLHPSEAPRTINWDDPEFCQYYIVKFCPHDLFVNTRADLGVCYRIHDDEAKKKYEEAKPSHRKKQFEDEFLHFCNSMLNDVDRKIQKGKQRLKLMQKDQPVGQSHMSKYQEQLNNLNARIKKLLAEAEEAGIRGDVDQAQDLMNLCEQLKEEKDALIAQHENMAMQAEKLAKITTLNTTANTKSGSDKSPAPGSDGGEDGDDNVLSVTDKKMNAWMQDMGHIPEKQMEVCEVCGAFLIVGDAQQRIEDHLTGKQHLGFLKLRKAVEEIHARRKKEREEEQRRKREDYSSRNRNNHEIDRKSEHGDHGRPRERGSNHHSSDRHRRHHKSHHRRRSHSRGHSHRNSRDSHSRSRSRSRY